MDQIDKSLQRRLAKLNEDTPPDIPATPVSGGAAPEAPPEDQITNVPPLPDVPAPAPAATPAPASPTQDPRLAAFLAKQAENAAALHAAQGKADEARRWTQLGNNFRRAEAILLRDKLPTAEEENARLAQADRPVQQLKQQQDMEAEGLKNYAAQQGVEKTSREEGTAIDANDPASPISRRAAALAVAQGMIPPSVASDYTASMFEQMKAGATYAEAMAHHKATEKQAEAGLEETRLQHRTTAAQQKAALEETATHHRAEEAAAARKATMLPEPIDQRLRSGIDALESIDTIKKSHTLTSPFDYGRTADALAASLASADSQTGKASPGLIARERGLMPSAFSLSDTYFDEKKQALMKRLAADLASHKAKGYDVSEHEARLADALKGTAPAAPANGRVRVIDPNGNSGTIPAEQLEAALARGFKRG